MFSELAVAIAQYAPHPTSASNLPEIQSLAVAAHESGAEILVLPEYAQAFIPGLGAGVFDVAEPLDGSFVSALKEISVTCDGLVLVLGMLVSSDETQKPTNTMIAVGPGGVLASAGKIHLYDAFGATESQWISAGALDAPQLLSLGDFTLGFMACYDLRFPESARRLVDAGATVIVVPAQWVPGPHKAHHWRTLLRSRAIENQVFVIAAGQPEPHGSGHSAIIDPYGETLLELGTDSELRVATIDSAAIDEARSANPMAGARRFGVVPLP